MADYLTLSDVKAYLSLSDTSRDTLISMLIPLVTASINTYCRAPYQTLAQRSETHYLDWNDSFRLWLDDWLQSVTTLTNGNAQVLVEGVDFLKYPLQGPPYRWLEIKRNSGKLFIWSGTTQRAISIAGVWGQSADVLALARLAGCAWVSFLMLRSAQEGVQSQRNENLSVTFKSPDPADPPSDIVRILKPFRWNDFRQPSDTRDQLVPNTRWLW